MIWVCVMVRIWGRGRVGVTVRVIVTVRPG